MKKADNEFIAKQMYRLKNAFPNQPIEFFDVLFDTLKSKNFSEDELTKLIDRCIETFEYKSLTVAAIIKDGKEIYVIPD